MRNFQIKGFNIGHFAKEIDFFKTRCKMQNFITANLGIYEFQPSRWTVNE